MLLSGNLVAATNRATHPRCGFVRVAQCGADTAPSHGAATLCLLPLGDRAESVEAYFCGLTRFAATNAAVVVVRFETV